MRLLASTSKVSVYTSWASGTLSMLEFSCCWYAFTSCGCMEFWCEIPTSMLLQTQLMICWLLTPFYSFHGFSPCWTITATSLSFWLPFVWWQWILLRSLYWLWLAVVASSLPSLYLLVTTTGMRAGLRMHFSKCSWVSLLPHGIIGKNTTCLAGASWHSSCSFATFWSWQF